MHHRNYSSQYTQYWLAFLLLAVSSSFLISKKILPFSFFILLKHHHQQHTRAKQHHQTSAATNSCLCRQYPHIFVVSSAGKSTCWLLIVSVQIWCMMAAAAAVYQQSSLKLVCCFLGTLSIMNSWFRYNYQYQNSQWTYHHVIVVPYGYYCRLFVYALLWRHNVIKNMSSE